MRLEIEDLTVGYQTSEGTVRAVNDISFTLEEGQQMGLVGESGCGKTTIAKSIVGLLPENGEVLNGSIRMVEESTDLDLNLVETTPAELRDIRWDELAMISQSAMNGLDPVYTIGDQIREAIQIHENTSDEVAIERAENLLDQVGIDKERVDSYPHQLSGGMRQRAMIAMSLALDPSIIIADEPTTALDVITQDHILAQIDRLSQDHGNSLLMITHDISVVSETCDRVGVMYAGELVEEGPIEEVFVQPEHPYTQGLLNAFPSLAGESSDLITIRGEPPDLIERARGCQFYERCPYSEERCKLENPPLSPRGSDRRARCFVTDDGADIGERYEHAVQETDRWQKL
jgi:oligopeptide/dipeptide ABC transporter ATP-binding protein